jgi:hypothetical protein
MDYLDANILYFRQAKETIIPLPTRILINGLFLLIYKYFSVSYSKSEDKTIENYHFTCSFAWLFHPKGRT